MNLRLVKASYDNKALICDMMEEWYASGEVIVPWSVARTDCHDYERFLDDLEQKEEKDGMVPDSTFFCLDTDRNIMVGAVNIRHRLNERLLLNGGHIGDGVRPSERGKGVATEMIGLALKECRRLGISRVLMVCKKDNIASARSIVKNGGVLKNEVTADGKTMQRYWIEL